MIALECRKMRHGSEVRIAICATCAIAIARGRSHHPHFPYHLHRSALPVHGGGLRSVTNPHVWGETSPLSY